MRVSAHAGWAGRWCGWCACVPLVGRTVVAWLLLVFVSAPLFLLPVWWNGRHARLKSGCPVGRAGSSPATGTGGNKTVEYGARVRVLWPTWGRVALWLVPPVGRWCPTFGGWCAGSCCALRVLDGCFVSLFLDSNPARSLGPTANRFAHIVWVGFDSSAVR